MPALTAPTTKRAAGQGPATVRLTEGQVLIRDDCLAAWLAERGMRLVA